MAKVLVAFHNGIVDEKNPEAMPAFYEAFIRGLDSAGNQVVVYSHGMFGADFGEIDEDIKNEICGFEPDICIIFNNSFFDLAEVVDCPIIIYEVDSPLYFSNKDDIRKKPDRYLYFIFQEESRKVLKEDYGVNEKQIYFVPFFTEVYADETVQQTTNVSFIGSLFSLGSINVFESFIQKRPSLKEKQMMESCLRELQKNSQVTVSNLIYKYNITSELVVRHLDLQQLLMMLSREKRLKVLSGVADLGLELYGTENWDSTYYNDSKLNMAYIRKKVYSVEDNQDIYNRSKIGINVSHLQAASGFPWRVMDIMASNACLVTEYHAGLKRLFGDIPIPVYESASEAYELCRQLVKDQSRRREIVLQCQETVANKYRFKHLLPKLEEYSGVTLHI